MKKRDGGKRVAVIGTGRVGTAMASVLASRGYHVVKVCDVNATARERAVEISGSKTTDDPVDAARGADIVLITTPDGVIEEVCRQVAGSGLRVKGKKFIHMSGALPLKALDAASKRGAGVMSVHPMQTFADVEGAIQSLPGSTFGVTCASALEDWARAFVADLDGSVLMVKDSDKALYHAAAVVACNLLTMIEHGALHVYCSMGHSEREALDAFMPLVHGTVDNMERLGPTRALTGPLARGDVETMKANLDALERYDLELAALYRAVCLYGLRIASERCELTTGAIMEMRSVLKGYGGSSSGGS